VNPLHFEDLEPHRFEDLVRQLVYDFRSWASIEATGRLGSDQGVDIRAIERISVPDDKEGASDADAEATDPRWEDRVWVIQCKREKAIPPARARRISDESMPATGGAPHGFLLAAACDFSAAAREAIRETIRERGVQELVVWGKAELEDLLFQPKNDHLLFSYFGISLATRRRSVRTTLGGRLTVKRRLVKLLGQIGGERHDAVLLRDANSTEYPRPTDEAMFKRHPQWRYFRFAGHLRPDYLAFVIREYFAWANFEEGYWDQVEGVEVGYPRHPELAFGPGREDRDSDTEERARRFWLTRVPNLERAHARVMGLVHYDRVALIDEIGDRYNAAPHILVDCVRPDTLFDIQRTVIEGGGGWSHHMLFPENAERRSLFPKPLPDIPDGEFRAAIERGT